MTHHTPFPPWQDSDAQLHNHAVQTLAAQLQPGFVVDVPAGNADWSPDERRRFYIIAGRYDQGECCDHAALTWALKPPDAAFFDARSTTGHSDILALRDRFPFAFEDFA